MKSFMMRRDNNTETVNIVELSIGDTLKLLLGRELHIPYTDIVIRQQHAHELFNLAAPRVET